MSKSKTKKYYRNSGRPATTTAATSAAPAPAPLKASTSPKPAVMVTSPTVGKELKVIGILSVLILAAIIVLSIVLR